MFLKIISKALHCHLLLATFCLRSISPAAVFTGEVCRAIKGPIPATFSFTWYIPLSPKKQSATFDVQVSDNFHLALVPYCSLSLPPAYNKYRVGFGEYANTWSTIGYNQLYNGALFNANRMVALWLSWAGGVITAGTGKVVGQKTIMSFTDPSPSPVNYMLIGGFYARGSVIINYCYDFYVFDRMVPIDLPYLTTSALTVLNCGRQCEQDRMCVAYSVVREVLPVENTACNVYYSISGRQYDPQHVTYQYVNDTYPS